MAYWIDIAARVLIYGAGAFAVWVIIDLFRKLFRYWEETDNEDRL